MSASCASPCGRCCGQPGDQRAGAGGRPAISGLALCSGEGPRDFVAAVWAGPPLDDAEKSWENDPRVKDLVPQLAQRRVPIEDAQKIIAEFVVGSATERERKGTLLFAGLFERINRERAEVMTGIERLGRRQKDLAEKIRSDISELHKLQDSTTPNETRIQELGQSGAMEHTHFRGSAEIGTLRMRGSHPDRTTAVRARPRGAAGNGVELVIARIEVPASIPAAVAVLLPSRRFRLDTRQRSHIPC